MTEFYSKPNGGSCVKLSMMIDRFFSGHSNVKGRSNFSFGSAKYLKLSIIGWTISSVIKTYCFGNNMVTIIDSITKSA